MSEDIENFGPADAGGMEYNFWLARIGRDRTTGYRWLQSGMIATINILGRHYVETEEIKRFWAKARAGKFATEPSGICVKTEPDQS